MGDKLQKKHIETVVGKQDWMWIKQHYYWRYDGDRFPDRLPVTDEYGARIGWYNLKIQEKLYSLSLLEALFIEYNGAYWRPRQGRIEIHDTLLARRASMSPRNLSKYRDLLISWGILTYIPPSFPRQPGLYSLKKEFFKEREQCPEIDDEFFFSGARQRTAQPAANRSRRVPMLTPNDGSKDGRSENGRLQGSKNKAKAVHPAQDHEIVDEETEGYPEEESEELEPCKPEVSLRGIARNPRKQTAPDGAAEEAIADFTDMLDE